MMKTALFEAPCQFSNLLRWLAPTTVDIIAHNKRPRALFMGSVIFSLSDSNIAVYNRTYAILLLRRDLGGPCLEKI